MIHYCVSHMSHYFTPWTIRRCCWSFNIKYFTKFNKVFSYKFTFIITKYFTWSTENSNPRTKKSFYRFTFSFYYSCLIISCKFVNNMVKNGKISKCVICKSIMHCHWAQKCPHWNESVFISQKRTVVQKNTTTVKPPPLPLAPSVPLPKGFTFIN